MTDTAAENFCIEFDDIAFTYDGETRALDGISLHVRQGEFLCVLGGNGSGKSTLAKHVNALLVPDQGEAKVLGYPTDRPENTYLVRSGAGMVFQNPDDQLVASIIEDDVAFGPENLGVAPAQIRSRVAEALAQVGLQGCEKKETAALSGGQKQRVAIAGALAMQPRILVLDEASAMLDPRGRKGLARVCCELNDAGMTIVMITHFMEEAVHADRVVVLDRGRIALEGRPEDVLSQAETLVDLALDAPFAAQLGMALRKRGVDIPIRIGRAELESDLAQLLSGHRDPGKPGWAAETRGGCADRAGDEAPDPAGEKMPNPAAGSAPSPEPGAVPVAGESPVVEFRKVSFSYLPGAGKGRGSNAAGSEAAPADWGNAPDQEWALHDVSLSIRQGEFLGLAGHTGSGKSTLIQLANGLLRPTAGSVLVSGHDLSDKRAAAEARRQVGVVFQYPEHQLFAATVFEDVAFGPRNLGLSADEVEQRVREAIALVHLDFDGIAKRSPFALSGGQQRRVAFAGVLAMRPSTLILDEPVAGLDPRARERFLDLVKELHDERGMTVVIVSHGMSDLARLCDRILVLNRGEAFALGTPAEVFSRGDELRAIGLDIPDTLHVARAIGLQPEGGAVPSAEGLADAIAARVAQASEGMRG